MEWDRALTVSVQIGWALHWAGVNDTVVFIMTYVTCLANCWCTLTNAVFRSFLGALPPLSGHEAGRSVSDIFSYQQLSFLWPNCWDSERRSSLLGSVRHLVDVRRRAHLSHVPISHLSPHSTVLNATLGNAVELIVAIIALVKCEIRVVQSSLLGSILSNLLLVLGMCFLAGGLKYSEQGFKETASQINSSLLVISVIGELRSVLRALRWC